MIENELLNHVVITVELDQTHSSDFLSGLSTLEWKGPGIHNLPGILFMLSSGVSRRAGCAFLCTLNELVCVVF